MAKARKKSIRISKTGLEQRLMQLLDNPFVETEDGEIVALTPAEIKARIDIVKVLNSMRGFDKPVETIVTSKVYELKF